MTEATLKNILAFMTRAAEAGTLKNVIDALAFSETYQAVTDAIAALQKPPVVQ